MQSQFPWAKPLSDAEVDAIFSNGIITFDANVLLDIYRVDKETRLEIKTSIAQFKKNLWISHQASYEFLKNKNQVEIKSKNIFAQYVKTLNDESGKFIEKIEDFQTKNRINIKQIKNKVEEYTSCIREKTKQISTDFDNLRDTYKDEFNKEEILEWIFDIFDEKVGEPFPSDTLESLYDEAKQRIADNIPPGYEDDGKDGTNRYGDFLLWKQLLHKSKHENKPIVFVTSEKKEDWFEKISGQIVQPRRELLEESMRETGQRFLIFRTESFLEKSARLRSDGRITRRTKEAIQKIKDLRINNYESVTTIGHRTIEKYHTGEIRIVTIRLNEPAYYFKIPIELKLKKIALSSINAQILDCPDDAPKLYDLHYEPGESYSFDIHFRSNEKNIPFPKGIYKIKYLAEFLESSGQTITEPLEHHKERTPDTCSKDNISDVFNFIQRYGQVPLEDLLESDKLDWHKFYRSKRTK